MIQVAFNGDGTKLVSAGQDATIKVWDLTSQPGTRRLQLGVAPSGSSDRTPPADPAATAVRWVGGVAFHPSGVEVAAAGTDHTIAIWDVTTGGLKGERRDGWGTMIGLTYNHQGTRLATIGTDRNVRIWDLTTIRRPLLLSDLREGLASIAMSPDGTLVATGGGCRPR